MEAAVSESVLGSTVRGLLAPRRAVPIALVVVPLTIIQDAYSRDAFAVPVALLMCASFLLVGPWLWRVLFPMGRVSDAGGATASELPAIVRAAIYAVVGAVLVVGLGSVLPRVVGAGRTFLTTGPSLVVCVALFWVGGWGLARDIDLEENLRVERARAEELAREAERAQLFALKSHLDPHFLFNTLNAIAEWCRADGEVAEKAILQLSSMLRTMMTGITSSTWPLEKEIELVDALFALHAVRDPSAFTVKREVPAALPPAAIPPMLLLPLAENAMKHGPLARHRGEVVFRVEVDGDAIRVELSNPGAFGGLREGGTGIPILEKRILLAYGPSAKLTVSRDGDRTRAAVVLPRATVKSTVAPEVDGRVTMAR